MTANICNICGANLIYKDGKWVCPACGAFKTEEISNEEVTLLYNAAQKLRLASFDDAEEAYRDIIAKYPENSEAHWGLVLSKYGIKYEDDYDGKKLPTCYATSIESVLTDKDYLDAVRLCKDKYQKEYYIEQGKVLEKIRVEWLEKASKEPKYDVFLCFKDSDKLNNMERTDDSIEVANLYTHLSSLGYKVFYSRESLRDKVAEKYEPYIYNALNTAAVMIVYGSKIEYFSSVWMKNEWTRYVRRLREGLKIEGSLVIACDGVNPGDLPRPLNQMQVLDARKKTFYGDLEAHIAKIISIARRPKATVERVEISSAIGKKKASIDNQIKTIKVGGGVGKKTPVVIDNAVSVREIGRYEVPALTPDEDTKLKSIAQFLRSGLFDPANKVADELLKKNKYNGQALLAKLLVEYSAKNIDELFDKINDINDFSIVHSVIEYNDKEMGEKVIGIICDKIKIAIQNGDYNKAESYFKEIAEYNSSNVTASRTTLRNKATELLKTNPDESDKIFALLLSTYSDANTYVSYLQGMVDDCLKVKNVALAKKYNDKILELDDGDIAATFNAVYLSVSACNIKEFIGLIDLYADFSQLDIAIKHFGEYEISVCFYTLRQIFLGALQSGKSGETLSKWFDFIVKYEFDTRKDFIEKTLNELAGVKSLQSRAKLFDHVINCIDGSDVDRHIELRLSLADKLRIGGEFSLAEKYYNEVIDIEEGNCNALWGILLCKLKANRESDISEKIDNFTYFSELEVILKYCPDEKTRVDYLDKLSAAVIMKSANLTDKTNIEKLSKIFDDIIKYYPEEFNGSLINYIQKFADNCKNSSAFSLAEKYYAMVLSIDNMRHSAYWGLLQAKLNCRNNDDLIKQNKIITEFTEFSSAIAASRGDERSSERYCQIAKTQLDYIEKQNTVAKQKKKRKSFIKKLTAAVAVMIAIVIGIFAFVGYRKSESVLKFSSNPTGVSVYAGNYYNSAIVDIPASSGNRQVTEIADNAFSGKNNITKVVLPSSVTKIGNNAFSGATALESINIPDSVTYIGSSAFNGCKNLKTITIPEKTVEIGSAAFSGCENLTEITIVARDGDINGFAEDWKAGLPSFTKIKMGFVINLDYNGATSGTDTNKPVVGVNENYTLPAPVRNGYKFLGWYDSLENGNRLTDESGMSISMYQKEQSITAYARWEANLNSIIFDANGGNGTMQNQQIATDSSANLSECAFTKVGYTFIGWGTTATQKTYDDKAEYAMGANSTYRLYAIWQANVNTLRFNPNGGNGVMSDMSIKTDETKALTACGFSRKGYDFAGWATSANGTKAYGDKANYLMGSDSEYILFALWTPKTYKITYNLNGGSVSNANKTEYTIESETFTLTNPTRPGYTFNGWIGFNLSDKTYTVSISTGSTGNLSFTANYDANLNSLLFNANGGVGETPEMLIETDKTVKLNNCAFSRKGYDFVGWATSANGEKVYSDGQNYTMGVNSEYVLYAVWKIKTYTIEYNLNNGTAPSNKTSYTVETDSFTLENPLRAGYTFIGFSGTDIADKSTAVTIEKGSIGNKSFTANWQANTNVLHFNANGGDGNMDDMSIKTDEMNTLPANTFIRKGYKFKGWSNTTNGAVAYLDSSSYKMGTAPVYTLYAVWEAKTNRLIFNGNGATSGGMDEMSIKTDESTILTDCGFAKIGYSFKGWATESNGSVKYSNKATYTMGTESSYTLYAVWQINQYTITLELNGGTASKNSITQDYNTVVEPLITTRPGYNFVEWYADSDFATVYNFSTMAAENITVYAKWQLDTTYTGEIGIRNIQELQAINEHLSGKFYLESDINATGFKFTPLGSRETPFSGAFDGKNKTITNLSISGDYYYAGLFGYSKAKIINVYLTNATVVNINAHYTSNYLGGIVGYSTAAIENCHWSGAISSPSGIIGGIVGYGINVSRCSVNGSIRTQTTLVNVGGIAGLASTVDNCYCDIKISAKINGNIDHLSMYKDSYFGGCIVAETNRILNSFTSSESYCNISCWNTGMTITRLCRKGTIENSFVVTSVNSYVSDGCSYINVKEIASKYYMTTKQDWSNDVWCWGYGSPMLYNDNLIKINYMGVDGLNNDKNPDAYKKGSDGFDLANATRTGYTFEGWFLDESYNTKVEKIINITEPLTLYAKWTPNNYVITFNAVGGDVTNATATVTYDAEYTLEVPVRPGYTFLGWYDGTGNSAVAYTDENGKSLGKWNLTDGITLYAQWQANTNMILFNGNGADFGDVGKITGQTDSYVRLPGNTFSKENYEFCGWSSSPSGDVELYDNDLFLVGTKSSYTLYAVWMVREGMDYTDYIPISTVEDLNRIRDNLSGKYYLVNDIDLYNVEWIPVGSIYEYNTSNYRVNDSSFTGVFDGNGFSIYNLTSKYRIVYCLSKNASKDFYYGGGLFGYNKGIIKNLKIYNAEEHFDLVDGSHSSLYAFYQYVYGGILCAYNSGTIINCYAQGSISFTTKKNISKDEKHYLCTEEYLMSVSLGGIVGFGNVSNCSADVSITSSVNSTLGKVTPNIENVKDLSIDDISWKDYKIRYLIENGTYRYQFAKYHALVKTIDYPAKKEGYSFGGWSKTENGSIDYCVGDECFIPIGSISLTLYPIWIPNNNVIKFNSNGGNGKMDDQMLATGITYSLSKNRFSKDGYHFIGWAETESGGVKYLDGSSYTMGVESNYVLYAVWEANENKILFNCTLGAGKMDDQIVRTDEAVTLNACSFLPPTGYYFVGWTDEENGTDVKYTDCASFTMTTAPSVTLYAIWEKVEI